MKKIIKNWVLGKYISSNLSEIDKFKEKNNKNMSIKKIINILCSVLRFNNFMMKFDKGLIFKIIFLHILLVRYGI